MSAIHTRLAVSCLQAGGIVAYPTEAVWGLGCDPLDRQAVLRLLQIKNRAVEKGMILVAASMEQITHLLDPLSDEQREMLAQSWPGPVTWLIPDRTQRIPWWIKGAHETVAVRVSAHPEVKALCQQFGGTVVSTSANRSGYPPARSRLQLMKQLGEDVDYVLPGQLGGRNAPSTIRDLQTGSCLR